MKFVICRYFSRRTDGLSIEKTYTCKFHRAIGPVRYFQRTYIFTYTWSVFRILYVLSKWYSTFFTKWTFTINVRRILPSVCNTRSIFYCWSKFHGIHGFIEGSARLCTDATLSGRSCWCKTTRTSKRNRWTSIETTPGWIKPRISGIHCRLLYCQIFLSATSMGRHWNMTVRPRYWIVKSGYFIAE